MKYDFTITIAPNVLLLPPSDVFAILNLVLNHSLAYNWTKCVSIPILYFWSWPFLTLLKKSHILCVVFKIFNCYWNPSKMKDTAIQFNHWHCYIVSYCVNTSWFIFPFYCSQHMFVIPVLLFEKNAAILVYIFWI